MRHERSVGHQEAVERHLSFREAAAQLGCSRSFIYKLCEEGLLSSVRFPGKKGKRLLPVSELNRLLLEFRRPSRQELLASLEIGI